MKTISFSILLFILVSSANAQLSKGQWMIGGRIDFSHANGDATLNGIPGGDSKNTQYEISPGAGYFFIDRFCGGLRIGAGGTHLRDNFNQPAPPFYFTYISDSKVFSFNISPFVRYYFFTAAEKINLFADASYTYSHGKSKSKVFESMTPPGGSPSVSQSINENKVNSNAYSIAAGPALFLNSKVSLEVLLKYSISKITGSGKSGNTFGAGAGFQVHLGK